MSNSSVTVVTVTFNSERVIQAMIKSVPATIPLVIVDNASSDGTKDLLIKLSVTHPNLQTVFLPENLGFGTGCNRGAALAETPYVLFLNPDGELQPKSLEKLVETGNAHPEFGATNPLIVDENGKQSISLRRYGITAETCRSDAITTVKTLSGSAFFCRMEAFEHVGGFDGRIFLYHEDDDLSRSLLKAGWKLGLVESVIVKHLGGQGTGASKMAFARQKSFHMAQARMYVEAKNGLSDWNASARRRAYKKLLSPLILFSKRKRIQAFAHLNGTRSFDIETYGRKSATKV